MRRDGHAVRVVILLLSAFASATTAASPSNLCIRATAAAVGVFRIDVAEPTPTAEPLPSRIESDGCRLDIDASGGVTLGAGERVVWAGEIRPLSSFGRAKVPGLQVSWAAAAGEGLYGLGERFNALNQAGRRCEMWIRDAPGQDNGNASYFCTPVVFSTAGYSLFAADNPEGEFDLNARRDGKHRYRRAGTTATFYLAAGDSVKELVRKRALIQGPFGRIPDWAWGLWMSRNSYENQEEAGTAIRGMVERKIPVSAIVLEAWKGKSETGGFHRVDAERWPKMSKFMGLCRTNGIRVILWQVPVLHPSSPDYAAAAKEGLFVRSPTGEPRLRTQWLEGFANFDFTNPRAVEFFKDLVRPLVRMGIRGFKVDDGEDIEAGDVFSDGRPGGQVHNEYPVLYARALRDLFKEEKADGVLWVRSGSLGSEEVPALWAGDQYASWEQLRSLVPAGLSAGLSGSPFWGHDIGGYIGTPTPELYIRWAQFGTFCPLMQFHGQTSREPWCFGPEAEQAFTFLAHLRMNLRPTLKALGEEAAKEGTPIMRPMIFEFPGDARFRDEDTQYMLGPDLLVAPVLAPGARTRTVKFPEGVWHHLLEPMKFRGPSEEEVTAGLTSPLVFVRDGAGLRVELDEGARLGTWRRGAPVRTLTFGP